LGSDKLQFERLGAQPQGHGQKRQTQRLVAGIGHAALNTIHGTAISNALKTPVRNINQPVVGATMRQPIMKRRSRGQIEPDPAIGAGKNLIGLQQFRGRAALWAL